MPRACIPNARFLAHADSPLLPFLAPRAFAEAPFLKRRKHDDDGGPQKEKETEIRGEGRTVVSKFGHGAKIGATTSKMLHGRGSDTNTLRTAMQKRYADISTLARQQLRSYNTRTSANGYAKVRRVASKSVHLRPRRRHKPRSPGQEEDTTSGNVAADNKRTASVSLSQAHRISRRKRAPRIGGKSVNFNVRSENTIRTVAYEEREPFPRKRAWSALEHVQRQLRAYRIQMKLDDTLALRKDGRYRSLRRRYFNYTRKDSATIDLRVDSGRLFDPHLRYKAFACLDQHVYPGIRRMTRRLCLRHDPRCSIWTARLFKNARTSDVGHHNEQIEENWMSFDEPERELIWPHLLVYLLHIWPGYALQFIRVLVHQPGVKNIEPDILADAFAHMSVIHARRLYAHRSWTHFRSWNVTNFVPTFTHFLRNYCCTAANRHICTQDLIYNLTRLADIEDLKVVFDLLEDANVFEFFDTILHYANTFAKAGEYKYALRCLVAIDRRAKEREQAISIANLERFRWTCALILRKSSGKGRNYHETTSIVTAFVELGSKLDILLYNVIMHNAMDAGDYSTAFKVYNSLEDNGLEPDKHTFSILLHGCTMTEDPFKFAEFANYCARIANEQRDSWLAADYLYYLYVCHQRGDRENRGLQDQNFARISKAYVDFFSPSTLRLIDPSISSMTPDQDQGVDAPPSLRSMTPPPMAFYLILQMYIQRASSSSDTDLWNLYLRFRQLVRTRSHPVLANLAENPVVWNAFLLAFARNRQFEWASQLIRDMTDHNPQPNVYSWNIFMQGFFKAEQVQAAERVFQLVRARGVEPDQFTYLTLLKGYIRAQHIEKIGETMDFVESEQQMDPMLVQALGRIHNRKRLMLALEKSQARREEDRRIKEEKKAESERKRWEKPFQREEEEQVTFGSALKPAPLQFGSFGADMGFKKGSE